MSDTSIADVSKAMTQLADHWLGTRARAETGSHIIYATTAGKTLHIWANETGPEIGATDAIKTFIETQGNAPVVAKFVRDYNRDVVNHYLLGLTWLTTRVTGFGSLWWTHAPRRQIRLQESTSLCWMRQNRRRMNCLTGTAESISVRYVNCELH